MTTATALRRELAAIPDRGLAVEREEGNIGISCVAAPIFGPLGAVVAAHRAAGGVGVAATHLPLPLEDAADLRL